MNKLKKLFKNWRFLLVLFLIIVSLFSMSISPGAQGVAVRTIVKGSSADLAGFKNPDALTRPMAREVIVAINGESIKSSTDFFEKTSDFEPEETVIIKTNKQSYSLVVQPDIEYITLNETNSTIQEVFDSELNKTVNKTVEFPIVKENIIGTKDLGLVIYDAPTSNIKKGLDLQGGTRVIIEPEDEITVEQFDQIKSNLEQRLNVFGLNDVSVSIAKDFQFKPEFIMIEIAGTTVEEIEDLVLSQGKFEAKIANETIFTGEDRDIAYVGKGPTESRINSCSQNPDLTSTCSFSFQIRLTAQAAQKMADMTNSLDTITTSSTQSNYLSAPLDLFLDDVNVSSLQIAASLKGKAETEILISGSGTGSNQNDAIKDATSEMKRLQTVIETGSLPTKLVIVKSDSISPVLGHDFTTNSLFVGFIALLVVGAIISLRYRKIKLTVPMVIALVSEVTLILGSYSVFGWTLDLAGIAGIIIVLGTGVDHLVIITDEVLKSSKEAIAQSWKVKIKKAFGIIMGAFLTTAFAMVPLLIAGGGLLRGFAVTTLTGLFIGVIIVRPTYGKVIEILLEE